MERTPTRRAAAWLLPLAGSLAFLSLAGPAHGSVTIGHVLGTGSPAPISCFPTCTLRQSALAPEDGLSSDGLTSPTNGTVTSIGINVFAANQDGNVTIRLRVLRGRTGVATSDPLTLVDADGTQTFPTDMPIAVGDGVGLDTLPTAIGNLGIGRGTAALNSSVELFSPPLLDGGSEQPATATLKGVLDMAAVIEPTNSFTIGKVTRNASKGTATVAVDVPNPGAVVVSGKGVKRASTPAAAPGTVKVKIAAKGKQRKALGRAGRVKLSAKLTFTPTDGDPRSRSKKLTLKQR